MPPSTCGLRVPVRRAKLRRKSRFLQSAFRGSPIHLIRRNATSPSSVKRLTAAITTLENALYTYRVEGKKHQCNKRKARIKGLVHYRNFTRLDGSWPLTCLSIQ